MSCADKAAWEAIAEAVKHALARDGLSDHGKARMQRMLDACRRTTEPPAPSPAMSRERVGWRDIERWNRYRIVIEAIGIHSLSHSEIAKATPAYITYGALKKVLDQLVEAGELDAVNKQPAAGGRRRWTYSRTVPQGPITELEVAFDGEARP